MNPKKNGGDLPPPLPPSSSRMLYGPRGGNLFVVLLLLIALFFGAIWYWAFCRIEPGPDEIAILIHKTGKDLPPNKIIATEPGEKGIQLEVLPEGRYFKNPYSWSWEIGKITDIPAGKLGVLTRLFGDDLPPGKIIATETSKGIVPDILRPGKYRVNPYAYDLEMFDAITVRPGSAGIMTSLVGDDVLTGNLPPEARNQFLVHKGMKGVLPEVLDPGTYYLNPYMVTVAEVTLQSQRFEMSGDDVITFLTLDGFNVNVEGTIEYALLPDKVAQLTQEVGEMDDTIKKIIMPLARGFTRIEGSKNPAKNYITGDTRQKFQDNLEEHLKTKCLDWGVQVRSVLIRNISPPEEIASVIRDREVAVQNARKFDQQIEQAKSQAELTRQETLAQQNKEKVVADTERIRAVIAAKQDQSVRLTAAQQELEVAKLENEAASSQADAILLKAEADKNVIALGNEAAANVIATKVQAFGGGLNFARYGLYQKLAPSIQTILSADDENSIGGLFRSLAPAPTQPQPTGAR
jgi:regulator of protease activity HflC (stomatin/prohibitin superfamily)